MYTQCPQCQAIFQVTAEHLKAAGGDVRCGQCLTVFNALDRLSEEVPTQSAAASEKALVAETITDDEPFADWTEPEPEPEFDASAEAVAEEIDLGDMDTAVVDVSDYQATEFVAESDTEFADFYEPPAESVETTDLENETIVLQSEPIDQEETAPAEPLAEEPRKTVQVPAVILEDLARAKAEHLRPSSAPWAVGSILLMLVFLTQAIYFARDDLARDPQLRPWLETACAYVGCSITKPTQTSKIEILGWDVRSHPVAPKALVAGTTLINNAPFAQPYPLLELRFSDMNGTPLAQRRFKPREYLPAGTDLQAGMPPNTPIQVELELMDPGSAAVNFEFHAITDPSTASQHS